MKAVVLESVGKITIRDMPVSEKPGPEDVLIAVHTVGICGSDVHYYQHGRIGPYVVRQPMILGHEASGIVLEAGSRVAGLKPGDRVCMEPGIPDPGSRATRLGIYNLDPKVVFWATPPVHGCLCERVVHPASFTFKLPDTVSPAEGAMVEPLAIGVHAAGKARLKPGDVALVSGAGTIGMMTAMAALAGGCSMVIISDVQQPKLDIAAGFGPVVPVNVLKEDLREVVARETGGWGVDVMFECSGSPKVFDALYDYACPGGTLVLVGIPIDPVPFDVARAQARELSVVTIFRYAHVYPRALAMLASGRVDVKPLITDSYAFAQAVEAFAYAARPKPTSVKVQIRLRED
jgi:D-xylulose reductase